MPNAIQNKPIVSNAPVRRPQQQAGSRTSSLSPETKSRLLIATMFGVLGATWFAKNKQDGGNALIQLSNDQFEHVTKKLKNTENTELKNAFDIIKQIREGLNTEPEKKLNALFGNKTELSQTELLTTLEHKFQTLEELDTFLLKLNEKRNKTLNLIAFMPSEQTGITAEFLTKLQEQKDINQSFVKAFQEKFPIGSKPTILDYANFLEKQTEHIKNTINKGEEIQRLLIAKNSNGMVSKDKAINVLKKFYLDKEVDRLQRAFDTIKNKLPKARIKGALKWAGIAIFAPLAVKAIFFIGRTLFGGSSD